MRRRKHECVRLRGAGKAERAAEERGRKTAEAACLLTPATGQERDTGTTLNALVRRAAVEGGVETQLRCGTRGRPCGSCLR